MKPRPMIALLTDFGRADSYVASMKGVIATIAPETRVIDLSHDVPPRGIDQAGYVVWSCHNFFPAHTIFVCVVDPGVGSGRSILLVEAERYRFLAPDNGLLKFIIGSYPGSSIIDVRNNQYFLDTVSATFHGRDIFAPVAAHLSIGVSPDRLGPATQPLTPAESFIRMTGRDKTIHARIVYVDRFGNIVTNIVAGRSDRRRISARVGKRLIRRFSRTYEEAAARQPFVMIGSSGLLEISLKNGNASQALHATINQPITVTIS